MAIRIAVGGEFFDKLREAGCYYVDKTELLVDLVAANNDVTLFTRPRRFGKTLTMSMIQSFFDITRDSREVFKGLAVTAHEDFCREWMNQYPVIFITLKDAESLSFSTAYDKLKAIIADVCKKVPELENDHRVDSADSEAFRRLRYQTASENDLQNSLKTIMRMMHAVYGKPVILLIDEYDVPLAKANENGYYPQMLDVIRGLLSAALKTNDYLKFAVVTGCLRIAKESIFTGVNNFKSYSVLDEAFSQYFGFTEEEVVALLSVAGKVDRADQIREWYDGYIFGSEAVYCPWDVINYVSDAQRRKSQTPKNYWKNTSSNGIVRAFVERTDLDVKDKFETLMNGGTITQAISDELTYDTLHETEENLWSVLLMTGYLTKADPDEDENPVKLKIPNREIAEIFEEAVVRLFKDTLDRTEQLAMVNALWNGDEETASKYISAFLWRSVSYYNYSEAFYKGFLSGVYVGLGYVVETEPESGLGRIDIRIKDRNNRRAIVFEAKITRKENQLEAGCEEALDQIRKRGYDKELDGYTQILKYGVCFYKKSALVKLLREN